MEARLGKRKTYMPCRDLKNCLDTAWRQGVEEGKHQVKGKFSIEVHDSKVVQA